MTPFLSQTNPIFPLQKISGKNCLYSVFLRISSLYLIKISQAVLFSYLNKHRTNTVNISISLHVAWETTDANLFLGTFSYLDSRFTLSYFSSFTSSFSETSLLVLSCPCSIHTEVILGSILKCAFQIRTFSHMHSLFPILLYYSL